jgi:hypothetical protein
LNRRGLSSGASQKKAKRDASKLKITCAVTIGQREAVADTAVKMRAEDTCIAYPYLSAGPFHSHSGKHFLPP